MSGPKSLSCAMFNKKLNHIFGLQSEIESLAKYLKKAEVMDKEREISFNCGSFIKKNISIEKNLLKTFLSDYKGTRKESVKVEKTLEKLTKYVKDQKEEKKLFLNKNEDYNDFIQYERFYDTSSKLLETYKAGVIESIKSILKGEYADFLSDAVSKISRVSLPVNTTVFSLGFRKIAQKEKNNISDQVIEAEKNINKIRTGFIDRILKLQGKENNPSLSKPDISKLLYNKQNKQTAKKILSEIRKLLCGMEDSPMREMFHRRLEKLKISETFKDPYFYTELIEDMKKNSEILKWKGEIKEWLVKLNNIEIAPDLEKEKNKLISASIKITNEDVVKYHEVEDAVDKITKFIEKNKNKIEEIALKKRQRQFLKQELVKGLEDLNYSVVEDMQVIDFEKENDFILKIPNQNNYLNLRFDENKTGFIYNFLIPENRKKLAIDEINQKINNMETACSDFKSVLKSLSSFGMKFNYDKEIPISENAMLQLPERIRKRLTQTGKKRAKTALKKMMKKS